MRGFGRGVLADPRRSAVVVDVSATDQTLAVSSILFIGATPGGTAGSVSVRPVGRGDAVILTVLPGDTPPVLVDKVYNTGTDATLIVAMY